MNPRHRRLIIPGLLAILLVVVVVTAIVREAAAASSPAPVPGHEIVSTLADERITESSGLVVSSRHADLAYTVNDSGAEPLIFAVRISSGETVGVTRLRTELVDAEALALDGRGRLWVADVGDNLGRRDDAALYVLDEPGEGDATVTPERHGLRYADGRPDVEAIAVDPRDGRIHLFSKDLADGVVYALPAGAGPGVTVTAEPVADGLPALITDASFAPDGSAVAVRTYGAVHDVDPDGWSVRSSTMLPVQPQGETLAFEPDGRTILIGSEGLGSALVRLPWGESPGGPAAASPAEGDAEPVSRARAFAPLVWVLGAIGVISMLVCAALVRRR